MGKIYAMSDIHGYLEVMEENLKIINLENNSNQLIFCGDYVGYGPKSCQVLYRIKELIERYPHQVVALKGNHETMFLEFLEADYKDIWNIEWIGGDKELSTLNTFINQTTRNQIKGFKKQTYNSIDLSYEIANIAKEDIKERHKDLITWLKNLPLYHEEENQIFVHAGIDEEPLSLWDDYNEEPFTKDTFIEALNDLHIGEWRRRYSTERFGYVVCDGTQWELEFEYRNGQKPVRFNGDNSYPYNFDKFQMLFGIDVTEEDNESDVPNCK